MMNKLDLGGILLATTTGFVACTALLGDDFQIVAAGTGGQGGVATAGGAVSDGGTGGATASTGGQGGEAPPPVFSCAWEFTEHKMVDNLKGNTDDSWSGNLTAVRLGSDLVRLVAPGNTTNGASVMTLYTIGEQILHRATVPADRVYGVDRVTISAMGVLYSKDDGTPSTPQPKIMMTRIDDNNVDLSSLSHYTVVDTSGFVGLPTDSQGYSINAQFAAIPQSGFNTTIDLMATYSAVVSGTGGGSGTSTELVEAYGRWHGGEPATMVRISPARPVLTEFDNYPAFLVHHEGTSYAFFGNPLSSLGTREYVLEQPVTGPQTPLSLLPASRTLFLGKYTDQGTNVLAYKYGTPLELWIGRIDNSKLGSIDMDADLTLFASYPTSADFDVQGGAGWVDDLFAINGPKLDKPSTMHFLFYDTDGRHRGTGELPFTATVGATVVRNSIDMVAVAEQDLDFGTQGGRLHVIWTEEHSETTPGAGGAGGAGGSGGGGTVETYDVMYYDQLNCTLSDT